MSDNDGPAIPSEFHETIFTPYGRATFDPRRTDSIGLGLTVSRQLARLMDGSSATDTIGKAAPSR